MRSIRRIRSSKIVLVAFVGALSFVLTACAGYDLEVDAPILNQVGLTTAKKAAPDIKERSPLIVPPTAQLPTPGSRADTPEDLNWPDDPDLRAKKIAALKAQQKAAEDKKKGPWNKALNSMLGTASDEEKKETDGDGNPLPPGSKPEEEEGGLLDGLSGKGPGSHVDMDERAREIFNR